MKTRLVVGFVFLAVALAGTSPAWAELAAPNAAGVSMGHIHLAVKDVEAERKFFILLGGTPVSNGTIQMIEFPGVFINIRQDKPTAGTVGSVVNHFGFHVRNMADTLEKLKPLGVKVEQNSPRQAFVTAPEDVRVELLEDATISSPVEMDHVHIWVTAPVEVQAWYVEHFGAVAGKRGRFDAATIPGVAVLFNQQDMAQAPTKGRSLDHIGFEVANLDETAKKLKAAGIKMDVEPRLASNGTTRVAFLTDPWGTYIELTQGLAPAKPPQSAGGVEQQVRPALLFREEWKQPPYTGKLNDENRRVTQDAVTNPNLELKLYGTDARNLSVYVHEGRHDLWTGMTTSPVAATLRDKNSYIDLTGLARLQCIVRTQGLHVLHPVVKLADGTLLAGSHSDATEGEYIQSEISFANQHWFKLDPQKVVTSVEVKNPDLSRVDEIGFVDLMPGGGHGNAGWSNISAVQLYAHAVPRDSASR